MQIAANQLAAQLQRGLKSLHTLHSDEPLLIQEAADAIRAAARQQGCGERTVHTVAGAHFDWGEVLASGLRALNSNPRCSEQDLRAVMEGSGRLVAHRLERYLSALATIASAAPLMGLFGTVVGMIEIFGAQTPTGGATGGNPAQLAHGISIALYNTAFGLIVAIPSLIFWRYFRARVDGFLLTLELASERLIRQLNQLRR